MSIYTAYVFVSIILHREPLRDEFENKDPWTEDKKTHMVFWQVLLSCPDIPRRDAVIRDIMSMLRQHELANL
jgi:hypothetical protein